MYIVSQHQGGGGDGGGGVFGFGGAAGMNPAAAAAAAAAAAPPNHAWGYRAMPTTFVGEAKIFIYGFVASLFPHWRVPQLVTRGTAAVNGGGAHAHQA